MEIITECPVCSKSSFKPYLVCKDYLVSQQDFNIVACTNCGFRLTNPRPDVNQIGAYYQSKNYVSHNDESTGLVNSVYRLVRNYTLKSKLKLINTLSTEKGRILDIGCGTGYFLETCQSNNWQIMGTEPDKEARRVAQQKLKVDIKSDLDLLVEEDSFDIITLWHVLEHVPNLKEVIDKVHKLLKPEGALLVAVPNSDSFDAHYFKQYWAAYDVPRHLYHFTPKTIKHLFNDLGFNLFTQKPMVFDAYYIAMLSTTYQRGKSDYIRSLKLGLKSNKEAKQTGNWSSLIYIFKHGS